MLEKQKTDGLYPCAFCSIWNVREENNKMFLDMMLIQRSGDCLAASGPGGINEVQYAVLQHLVAKHCGFKVGRFTHVIGNEEIYDRHLEQAKMMLERKTVYAKPVLKLNTDKTNFYDFTLDDIELLNYNKNAIDAVNPQVKLDLGI